MLRVLVVSIALSASALAAQAAQVRSVPLEIADNAVVAASPDETVEVIFTDGTSLLMSAGTNLVVDRYRYDRASRTGELQLHVQNGTVRVLGGTLNNSNAIVVGVPGGRAALDNAVAYVSVNGDRSELALVAGRGMTVQGAKGTFSLNQNGSALSVNSTGEFAGNVRRMRRDEAVRYASTLNPGLTTGEAPKFVVDRRAGEDVTAKDVKVVPALSDPVAPAGCTGSACVSGAPNFDLASSVGSIGNRQLGRTFGATWGTAYPQGSPIAAQSAANAPPADFSSATDGFRNTTARIFAASASTPYALTFDPTSPPLSISRTDEMACLAGTAGACHSSPITNLYSGTSGARYSYIGLVDLDYARTLMIAFEDSDFPLSFGSFPLLAQPLVDLNQQGVLLKRAGTAPLTGCVDSNNFGGACTYEFATAEARQAQRNDPVFLRGIIPSSSTPMPEVFSDYTPQFTETEDFNKANPYLLDVNFQGVTATDTRVLQTGFRRVAIENSETSLATYCTLGTAVCTQFAGDLFGIVNGEPDITYDISRPLDLPTGFQSAQLVARDDDSFLGVEGLSRLPNDTQRMFYATGSVSGRLTGGATAQGATLDTFTLSPGLDPAESMGRAFLRPDTLMNIAPSALLSSGLRVLNAPYSATISAPSRAYHYDFAESGAGTGSGTEQTSTLSVTLATLTYDAATKSAQLSGRTVGSTQRSGTIRYTGGVQSPLFSTATGGGNPNLPNTGRVGYLALENYDPVSSPTGGLERTIENGVAAQTNYAQLRFGQVLAGGSHAAPTNLPSLNLSGYVGGLVEVPSPTAGSDVELRSLLSNSLTLLTDATQGSAGAAIDASIGADTTTVNLGTRAAGGAGLSAYMGDKDYAAMTRAPPNLAAGAITDATSANAALISGAPLIGSTNVQGWLGADLDNATRAKLGAGGGSGASSGSGSAAGYRYLQWGFLVGDLPVASGRTAHAHLTSWIAGRPTPEGTPLPTGTADYAGHVFANISNGGQVYSSVGTFANHWDFATRSGTGAMNLDGQSYGLRTRLLGLQQAGTQVTSTSTSRFDGLISAQGESAYVGGLNGSFVADPAATTDPLQLRSGVMGQFSLSRTLNGNPYHATGTFGAERTTP